LPECIPRAALRACYGPHPTQSEHAAKAALYPRVGRLRARGEKQMKRNLLAIALLAITLAGCVVVPARPVYVRPAPVVIY
jgi:hypothetical protein